MRIRDRPTIGVRRFIELVRYFSLNTLKLKSDLWVVIKEAVCTVVTGYNKSTLLQLFLITVIFP